MAKIKEGFKGERFISLPDDLLAKYSKDPIIGNLYIRKIGFFPHVKYHYVQKENGCDYSMLIYCIDGEGWYKINDKTYPVRKNEYIIIPEGVPYSFGADNDEPWSIYWLHFKGKLSKYFAPVSTKPKEISPSDNSRVQERLQMFEEIYRCFSMGYIKEYMMYSSLNLYAFLSSFVLLEQYRSFASSPEQHLSFSAKVIHYMQENIQHNLSLEQLSSYFRYSPSHLSMLFQKETGVSPISYFLRLKIQKACQYIELTDMKLNEIAMILGFEEPAYFSRLFTKIMGMSPSAYRKKEIGTN